MRQASRADVCTVLWAVSCTYGVCLQLYEGRIVFSVLCAVLCALRGGEPAGRHEHWTARALAGGWRTHVSDEKQHGVRSCCMADSPASVCEAVLEDVGVCAAGACFVRGNQSWAAEGDECERREQNRDALCADSAAFPREALCAGMLWRRGKGADGSCVRRRALRQARISV